MDHLVEGYRRFRSGAWIEHRARFDRLAEAGQSPQVMVIACSDSRADPQLIFDAAPGEIFSVRNVANLVPPYAPDAEYHGTSAALEFAVRALEVEDIVVMGHASCGGVRALLEGAPGSVTDFVAPWMSIAGPARERALIKADTPEARQRTCEHETVKISLANLMTFPWIAKRVEAGVLRLHGYYFAIATGVLSRLDGDGAFTPV
jgi:carbonic anhydrase